MWCFRRQSLQTDAAVEMEKRRQKLHEQQLKRREEKELKRLAQEAENNRKREAQKYLHICQFWHHLIIWDPSAHVRYE